MLAATSLGVAAVGVVLPFTPVGAWFGFTPPPARFYIILAVMVLAYLAIVEVAKRGFYTAGAECPEVEMGAANPQRVTPQRSHRPACANADGAARQPKRPTMTRSLLAIIIAFMIGGGIGFLSGAYIVRRIRPCSFVTLSMAASAQSRKPSTLEI